MYYCTQAADKLPRYSTQRCNGTDSPVAVIVSPGDHLNPDEYVMDPDDDYHPDDSPGMSGER